MGIIEYFTRDEVKEIVFSVLAISLALALAVSGDDPMSRLTPEPSAFAHNFLLFLIAIAPGFALHEMAHKFTAIHYGCKAKFKAWLFGIGIMFVFAIGMGFMFAAPGAVYIFAPYLNRKENGIISAAGAVVNIVLSLVSLLAVLYLSATGYSGFWLEAASFSMFINAFFAAFNMTPMYPLDGSKVISWSWGVWLAILAPALLLIGIVNIDAVQFVLFLIAISFLLMMVMPKRAMNF